MTVREVLIGIVCLVIGLVGGFFVANSLNRGELATATSTSTSAGVTVPDDGMQSDVTSTLTAADSDPRNFPAQMRAGDMYAQIGRFEKAVEFYKRGVLINPSNFQANVTLANALFDSQQFEEAEQYYARALQIQPDNADARTDLGATFVERSSPDYQRAIAEFEQVQSSNPQHLPSLYYLGIATLRKGDKDRAKKVLAELERKGPQSELVGRLRQNIEAAEVTR